MLKRTHNVYSIPSSEQKALAPKSTLWEGAVSPDRSLFKIAVLVSTVRSSRMEKLLESTCVMLLIGVVGFAYFFILI